MDVQDDKKSAEMTEEGDTGGESEIASPQESIEGEVDAAAAESIDDPVDDGAKSEVDAIESDAAAQDEQTTPPEEPQVEQAEAAAPEEPESAQPEEEPQPDDGEPLASAPAEDKVAEEEAEAAAPEEPESAQPEEESQPDEGEPLASAPVEAELEEEGASAVEGAPDPEVVDQQEQVPLPQQDPADMNEYVEAETADTLISTEEAPLEEEKQSILTTPEIDDGREWYVVHCYSGYENKVRHNLEQRIESMGMKNLIFDVVVPTEEEIEVKDGKRRTVERRVFPGYILINMILGEESWYVVRNTPGVTSFVGMGEEPTPLRPEEVSQIIKRMESDAPRIKVTFKQGERVRIVDGPFNDFRGNVDEIDMERAKVRVMVNFFGRETPVELDFLQVEKA